MCIICNVKSDMAAAGEFLSEFAIVQKRMKRAADAMLRVSAAADPEHRRKYDRTHKQMKRVMKMWNMIEHEREVTK